MNKNEAKDMISSTFSSDFNEQKYKKFVSNLFKKYNPVDKIVEGRYIKQAFAPFVVKYKIAGTFEDSEGNKIDILEVNLSKASTLERARTAQRNFVAEYLKSRNKVAALVAFVSPDNKEWRLSLVKLEHSLEVVEEKLKTTEEITPAKRWSFLVGESEGSHTAQSRFIDLLVSDEDPNLAELESAFDIETVTKEFFTKYTELYFQLKEHLDSIIKQDEKIKNDFEEKEISPVDFAKKTLGQIVFLYFLQKKGWFGVAPDQEWGEGPKKFLRELFERRAKYGENFFNDILEPLFYKALAQDRGKESIYPDLNNCRMPFLNGGLFEPMNGYMWETTDIIIPDSIFSNNNTTKEGDKGEGDGIFDVFDRYNFTVNENEPLEKEVAVDPEMLGKVFENLLDIKDRKSKGAFYTPREIVHYMCQESLINYLESETKNEIPRTDIELFIQKGDRIIENDKITLARKEERKKKYGNDKYKDSTYSLLLPESVRMKADKLDELLKNIKVADPAVGSGAFPLGMINEIVRARKVLNVYIKRDISDYELKKHTITHSIYGVDIDPGAVDIAKLRLWLALVVDEETPHPLPNLEHKIMQGNSLISEYEGIKLFDESIFEEEKSKGVEQLALGLGKTSSELKMEVLQDKIASFVNESQKTKKQNLKEEIDNLKWELIEETLKEQGKEGKLEEIKKLRQKNIRPFFIWKLEFSDVFLINGGFDVVIGNPPYVSHDKIEDKAALDHYFVDQAFADLYCYFYEKGSSLLKLNGVLSFITSNSFIKADYGEKLRTYLGGQNTLSKLINIEDAQVFESAIINTVVVEMVRGKESKHETVVVNKPFDGDDFITFINSKAVLINSNYFVSQDWILEEQNIIELIKKIVSKGKTLEKRDTFIRLGLATGSNEVFVIDNETKESLITKDPHSTEIIKPTLRGRDIDRYKVKPSKLWLILSKNGVNVKNDYPAIYEYFDSFGQKFKDRGAKGKNWWNLRACSFFDTFKEDKIVWIELTDKNKFSLCKDEVYLLNSSYFLIPPQGLNIKYLLSILNSKLIRFYMEKIAATSGMGTLRWINNYVKTFPIPDPTLSLEKDLINLVENIEEYILNNKDAHILEGKIDEMVMDLYNLTDEEKEIIRKS